MQACRREWEMVRKRNTVRERQEDRQTDRQTHLAFLVRVFLHPHPGHVDLRQSDWELETLWTHDFSWQHAHHGFTVCSLHTHTIIFQTRCSHRVNHFFSNLTQKRPVGGWSVVSDGQTIYLSFSISIQFLLSWLIVCFLCGGFHFWGIFLMKIYH